MHTDGPNPSPGPEPRPPGQDLPPPPCRTVSELLALYLRHSEANQVHGPEALKGRRHTLGLFAQAYGALPAEQLRPFHLTDWIDAHPAWKSSATRRGHADAVRAAFRGAYEGERIARNPFARVRYPEAEPRPPLPDDVLEAVLLCANKRFERALRFLRLTGCRLGELCGLTWACVDLDVGLAVIEKHKSRRKTGKPKVIPLVAEALALLLEVRRTQPPDYQGAVFRNNRGTPWTRTTLVQQLRRMKLRGEVETPASLHGIRHQFGTEAVRNGAPLKMVSLALGHSSTTITEKYYTHINQASEEVRQAAQAAQPKRDL